MTILLVSLNSSNLSLSSLAWSIVYSSFLATVMPIKQMMKPEGIDTREIFENFFIQIQTNL